MLFNKSIITMFLKIYVCLNRALNIIGILVCGLTLDTITKTLITCIVNVNKFHLSYIETNKVIQVTQFHLYDGKMCFFPYHFKE